MITATTDITFQYPPELFNLLVDTVPLLNRSKKDVVLFFRGAGVPDNMLADITQRLRTNAANVNKYEIARTVFRAPEPARRSSLAAPTRNPQARC
jgi:hypothetical protein